ncbi:MAG: DNA-binding response regulator [Verrucomicrobiales bacterium]|nr:DNA-binding response regulator [Verrucomicrobiales bacterium]
MSISVSIVEDDEPIRQSLALIIEAAPGFRCLATYPSAEQALKGIPQTPPDVALVDINLPVLSGVECVRRLKVMLPKLQIIMHTVYEDSEVIFDALEAGASGYLLKRTAPAQLLEAIQEVHRGGAPMSSHIARKVVQSFQKRGRSAQVSENLSPREEEILNYVAKGYINKEIAEALAIGSETVHSHLKSIYYKLHVRSRTEAVMKYMNK